mmetsp:Transcript_16185/g.38804  ORF Transcript_16185/g.38804 Transcript_16185/m.38804 type:complete len:114 (+) Transcript_16185:293-634(+)
MPMPSSSIASAFIAAPSFVCDMEVNRVTNCSWNTNPSSGVCSVSSRIESMTVSIGAIARANASAPLAGFIMLLYRQSLQQLHRYGNLAWEAYLYQEKTKWMVLDSIHKSISIR